MPFDHFEVIAPLYARAQYSNINMMCKAAELPAKGRLLDVGGGTGRVSSAVRDYVDEVIVADVSFGMLRQIHHKAASAPLSADLKPVCGGSESLPFADNFFERVIMVDAFHHVTDQAESAREMLRVLKPGGVLVIEEPDIRTFGVKLIALAEKLLFMNSHFLSPQRIGELFTPAKVHIHTQASTAWVVVKK
jgi:demethylmenaquinone methyltransferase/2-methoxy-6-polyprenyl-1,4-benzoquinol methylase